MEKIIIEFNGVEYTGSKDEALADGTVYELADGKAICLEEVSTDRLRFTLKKEGESLLCGIIKKSNSYFDVMTWEDSEEIGIQIIAAPAKQRRMCEQDYLFVTVAK